MHPPWKWPVLAVLALTFAGLASGSARSSKTAVARFARIGLPVFCGGHHGRYVALTFDDGPSPATERTVLSLLRKAKARATFFDVGQNVSAYPSFPRKERAIERATGRRPNVFRPPYGAHNATVDATARSLGLVEVLWSIDSYDSRGYDRDGIVHTVLKLVQPGSIVLMHDTNPETVKALPKILRVLRHRRFKLVTVAELLALDPPSLAQLRRGFEGCYSAK